MAGESGRRTGGEDGLPDFSGRVVLFYVKGLPGGLASGVMMEEAVFRRLGDKLFVIGSTPAKTDSMWASRLESGVAWDAVVHYLVFASREDYERRMANSAPGLARRFTG